MSDNPQNDPNDHATGENGTAVTGSAHDGRMADGENALTLTTRQGHPISNNQNSRTVGNRGPATLEKYQLIEKISHFDHATQDLYENIKKGNFPKWELRVQIMSDDEHPELDFDPLDDTKIWPEDKFPHLAVGMMTLNKNPENYFAEVEQVAFGTGVLIDGLDFSDDKMLQGRTFSYSDTQRYRVGPNYLQLPINAPKKHVATNQRDGQMTFCVDTAPGQSLHVNYEPSSLNGLKDSASPGPDHTPSYTAKLVRQTIDRTNNFGQAGDRYRQHEDWERDELISNMTGALADAEKVIQDKMIELCTNCDADWGRRLAEGLRHAASQHSGTQANEAQALEAVTEAEEMAHDARPY